jgi:hypothetical protein
MKHDNAAAIVVRIDYEDAFGGPHFSYFVLTQGPPSDDDPNRYAAIIANADAN